MSYHKGAAGRRIVTAAVGAVASTLIVAPALANTVSIKDPSGDVPDITSLRFANNQHKVIAKLRFSDISLVRQADLLIKDGDSTFYRAENGNFDQDVALEERLVFVKNGSATRVKCGGLTVDRNAARNITKFIVPRPCLDAAPNRVAGQGKATAQTLTSDTTKVTKRVKRG